MSDRAGRKSPGRFFRAPGRSRPAGKPWRVYMVRCADGSLYTGVARDAARRLDEHNGKGRRGAKYTRARRPVQLVYVEGASNRSRAMKREAAIKRLSRRKKEALLGPG